jgi:hypothetical protein
MSKRPTTKTEPIRVAFVNARGHYRRVHFVCRLCPIVAWCRERSRRGTHPNLFPSKNVMICPRCKDMRRRVMALSAPARAVERRTTESSARASRIDAAGTVLATLSIPVRPLDEALVSATPELSLIQPLNHRLHVLRVQLQEVAVQGRYATSPKSSWMSLGIHLNISAVGALGSLRREGRSSRSSRRRHSAASRKARDRCCVDESRGRQRLVPGASARPTSAS